MRERIKISEQIDSEMKIRIKRIIKTAIIQKYNTLKAFCEDFKIYLESKGKRSNFTDRVLSNKLNRGDIRFYEVLEILDFLELNLKLSESALNLNFSKEFAKFWKYYIMALRGNYERTYWKRQKSYHCTAWF